MNDTTQVRPVNEAAQAQQDEKPRGHRNEPWTPEHIVALRELVAELGRSMEAYELIADEITRRFGIVRSPEAVRRKILELNIGENPHRRWSRLENRTVLNDYDRNGRSAAIRACAKRLGRTERAVEARLRMLLRERRKKAEAKRRREERERARAEALRAMQPVAETAPAPKRGLWNRIRDAFRPRSSAPSAPVAAAARAPTP